MKFVTDAITNVVLFGIKHAMGLDVKEIANYGMQTADEGKAKAGEGSADTTKAGAGNDKVGADIAAEDMTLGQRIAAGQKNVADAESFEQGIDAQEAALKAEIKACQDFVKQVEEQFNKCKAEAATAQPEAEDHQEDAPSPDGGAAPGPTGANDVKDPNEAALLQEAKTLCGSSIETEIAELKALDAKGAGILMAQAGNDPASVAEADRLAKQIEAGGLRDAISKLTGLKAQADGGAQETVVAAAEEIDTACHDGAEAVANAYIAAGSQLLATPDAGSSSHP